MQGDKKQKIYEGVISLLDRGIPLRDLTVSKIAMEAGVGKGTVYEYFNTKDEVIARAVYYQLSVQCGHLETILEGSMSFKEKCYLLFSAVAGSSLSALPVLYGEIEMRELLPLLRQIPEEFLHKREEIKEALSVLLYQGQKEGVIPEVDDLDYAGFTFVCILSGLHTLGKDRKQSVIEKNKEMAYRLLLNAFKS